MAITSSPPFTALNCPPMADRSLQHRGGGTRRPPPQERYPREQSAVSTPGSPAGGSSWTFVSRWLRAAELVDTGGVATGGV